VTTKYVDTEGNVKSKKRAELSGKSVVYEGEYSETDSEAEYEFKKNGTVAAASSSSDSAAKPSASSLTTAAAAAAAKASKNNEKGSGNNVGGITSGLSGLKVREPSTAAAAASSQHHKPLSGSSDASIFKRQRLVDNIPNIELKPVKCTEFSESIDENSGDEEGKSHTAVSSNGTSSNKVSQAEMQAKITSHLQFSHPVTSEADKKNIIKDETKEDEKSDIKIIDSTDEKTGQAIRTSIENKMKTNENIKVLKGDETVDVKETDDAIIKKITTKTKTTKSVVKTTTTTTTKKGDYSCVACGLIEQPMWCVFCARVCERERKKSLVFYFLFLSCLSISTNLPCSLSHTTIK
jgi:hypothetical protein